MKKSKTTKVFEKIAVREGISVTEVREEIQRAIDIGMLSSDPTVQGKWSKMHCRGEKPTPEEVVLYLSKQVNCK
jgi:hypothetical protein